MFGGDDYDRLSELGERQARATGAFLAARGMRFDRVLVGPRRRHRQSAEAVLAAWPEPGKDRDRAGAGRIRRWGRAAGIGSATTCGQRGQLAEDPQRTVGVVSARNTALVSRQPYPRLSTCCRILRCGGQLAAATADRTRTRAAPAGSHQCRHDRRIDMPGAGTATCADFRFHPGHAQCRTQRNRVQWRASERTQLQLGRAPACGTRQFHLVAADRR